MTEQPNPNVDDITGYRRLSQHEISLINETKCLAERCRNHIDYLDTLRPHTDTPVGDEPTIDKRWLAIARTDLQKGFMALIRSIAKPTSF